MSASEQLKALDGPMLMADPELTYEENARRSFDATLALRNALPQIVAVVEAAEENDARWKAAHMSSDFSAALTALEEALS